MYRLLLLACMQARIKADPSLIDFWSFLSSKGTLLPGLSSWSTGTRRSASSSVRMHAWPLLPRALQNSRQQAPA